MKFASAWTNAADPDAACDRIASELYSGIGDHPDVLIAFVSQHHMQHAEQVLARLRTALSPKLLLAVSAESVIGGTRELERTPAITALAGVLPGVTIRPLDEHDLDRPSVESLVEHLQSFDGRPPQGLLLFADPFTVPIISRLQRLGEAFPDLPVAGGLASAGRGPGSNLIARDDHLRSNGLVGLALFGPVHMDTLVSQGCKPIGPDLVIDETKRNLVSSLGGKPALDALKSVLDSLEDSDRAIVRTGLFIGRVIDESKQRFGRGDYLVRAVVGADPGRGYLALDEPINPGQTVRFHLRDAETARSDLELLLNIQQLHGPPAGALLMTSTGRGERLFGTPDFDARTIARAFQQPLPGEQSARAGEAIEAIAPTSIPLAGFHAAGEIGPIGGMPFLHNHAACLTLFRPPEAPGPA